MNYMLSTAKYFQMICFIRINYSYYNRTKKRKLTYVIINYKQLNIPLRRYILLVIYILLLYRFLVNNEYSN